jgi:hypothetical protein|tara:strand:- start:2143 stop:2664 length:522 start_codon:yes stop_codon:yes gene_type:complete
MEPRVMIRNYCLVGMGEVSDIKEDIVFISETNPNYVGGKGMLISTFSSTLHILEVEDFLNLNERSFIIFEMTPGFFSATLNDRKLQNLLFGGKIDNSDPFSFKMEENLREFIEDIRGDVISEIAGTDVEFTLEDDTPLTLDELLDKINDVGYKNLTTNELNQLKKYSTLKRKI